MKQAFRSSMLFTFAYLIVAGIAADATGRTVSSSQNLHRDAETFQQTLENADGCSFKVRFTGGILTLTIETIDQKKLDLIVQPEEAVTLEENNEPDGSFVKTYQRAPRGGSITFTHLDDAYDSVALKVGKQTLSCEVDY